MSKPSDAHTWLEQAARDAYKSIARQYDEASAELNRHSSAARQKPADDKQQAQAAVPSARTNGTTTGDGRPATPPAAADTRPAAGAPESNGEARQDTQQQA